MKIELFDEFSRIVSKQLNAAHVISNKELLLTFIKNKLRDVFIFPSQVYHDPKLFAS